MRGSWYEKELMKISQISEYQAKSLGKISKIIKTRTNRQTGDKESLVHFQRRPKHS